MKQSKKIKQIKLDKFNDLKVDNTSSVVGGDLRQSTTQDTSTTGDQFDIVMI